MRLLLVDNHDSFTYNLVQALATLGATVEVRRNDAIEPGEVLAAGIAALVVSPGPGRPEEAGATPAILELAIGRLPVLGICLGHQAIAQALGARVERAARPLHGRAGRVRHDGTSIFAGLPSPLEAGRYHSLAVDAASLPRGLAAPAFDEDGTLMAIADEGRALYGLQFHPESVLTPLGPAILDRFLARARARAQ